MNHDKDDKKIMQLFRQLRQQDERRTPSFARMWATVARSQTISRRRPLPVFRFAVAVVLLLVVAGSAFLVYRISRVDAFRTAESITQWQSPTHSLLEFSREKPLQRGQHLLTTGHSRDFTRSLSEWQSPTASLGYAGRRRFQRYREHLL